MRECRLIKLKISCEQMVINIAFNAFIHHTTHTGMESPRFKGFVWFIINKWEGIKIFSRKKRRRNRITHTCRIKSLFRLINVFNFAAQLIREILFVGAKWKINYMIRRVPLLFSSSFIHSCHQQTKRHVREDSKRCHSSSVI